MAAVLTDHMAAEDYTEGKVATFLAEIGLILIIQHMKCTILTNQQLYNSFHCM